MKLIDNAVKGNIQLPPGSERYTEVLDLVRQILVSQPSQRCKLPGVMAHPWFQAGAGGMGDVEAAGMRHAHAHACHTQTCSSSLTSMHALKHAHTSVILVWELVGVGSVVVWAQRAPLPLPGSRECGPNHCPVLVSGASRCCVLLACRCAPPLTALHCALLHCTAGEAAARRRHAQRSVLGYGRARG